MKALNGEAQDRWDDDGGAIPMDLDVLDSEPGSSMIDVPVPPGAHNRTMLLDNLELADRYFAESEHRIARQHRLISKLSAQGPTPLWAVAFLRSLQASRVMHRSGRRRLQRALAILDEA